MTAECARVIHSGVSSHSGEAAVKYVEIDSRSERKRRGSDSTVVTWRRATECDILSRKLRIQRPVCPTEVSSVDRKRSLEDGQASEPEGAESLFLRPGYCRQEVKSEAVL